MRKIRKFSVNESGFMLSPEEMRRINGGGNGSCKTDQCYAYMYVNNEVQSVYSGYCGTDYADNSCACLTTVGSFYGDNNECG